MFEANLKTYNYEKTNNAINSMRFNIKHIFSKQVQ